MGTSRWLAAVPMTRDSMTTLGRASLPSSVRMDVTLESWVASYLEVEEA